MSIKKLKDIKKINSMVKPTETRKTVFRIRTSKNEMEDIGNRVKKQLN